MASFAECRTAITAALLAEGIALRDTWQGEPPYALLFLNGSDLSPFVDGRTAVHFRLTLVVSKALDSVSLTAADAIVNDAMVALVALDDWRIDSIGPLSRVDVGTDRMYAVDINLTTMVTFS